MTLTTDFINYCKEQIKTYPLDEEYDKIKNKGEFEEAGFKNIIYVCFYLCTKVRELERLGCVFENLLSDYESGKFAATQISLLYICTLIEEVKEYKKKELNYYI